MSVTGPDQLHGFLEGFIFQEGTGTGGRTIVESFELDGVRLPRFTNEFWTSKQRQASSIHEVSYRACFKPQLPRFFIELLTKKGDVVYDPFSGRGTTVLEAGLLGRNVIANDINPLSRLMSYPRFFIPDLSELKERLASIPLGSGTRAEIDLTMFYHERTESELVGLRRYLSIRNEEGTGDDIDRWIGMVATNRLTGHSKGFFSVYTLPPNQAVSPKSQRRINLRKGQVPEYRDVKAIIARKTRSLTRDLGPDDIRELRRSGAQGVFLDMDARDTSPVPEASVHLIVTSPPFLDTVQYGTDNWLRCWFNSLDVEGISSRLTVLRDIDDWTGYMRDCFREFERVLCPGGHVAFEVGEVRKGIVRLDEHIAPVGIEAGLDCLGIVVNSQEFTKTSNIWGVDNMRRGTNTNRIVVFRKPI